MAAHRYWRVGIDTVQNPGRNCRVAGSIEFYTTREGPDVTIAAPGAAICSNDTYGAKENAFDHNDGTLWHNGCDQSFAFIGWQFGATAGDWPDVIGFKYVARGGGYGGQDSIATGGLEYSDDGSTWTRLFSIPAQSSYSDGSVHYFFNAGTGVTEPGGYRFWKLVQTTATARTYSGFGSADLRKFDETILTSRVGSGHGANFQAGTVDSLFTTNDGSGIAQWYDNVGNYFFVDFLEGYQYAVRKIKLWPNHDDVLRTWTEIDIYASNDDITYDYIDHISAVWVAGVGQEFTIAGPAGAERRRAAVVVC